MYCTFAIIRAFLKESGDNPPDLRSQFQELHDTLSHDLMQNLERMSDYDSLMERYEHYMDLTRSGEHGKTAAFWMMYVDLVELYLLCNTACHTHDAELIIFCLGKMCAVFFATSRPNYA